MPELFDNAHRRGRCQERDFLEAFGGFQDISKKTKQHSDISEMKIVLKWVEINRSCDKA
jgi:hypothetical protein